VAIVRRYLRDPKFSHFDTIPECDGQTDKQTDRQTHTHTHTRRHIAVARQKPV